ncbi:hypothetical protein BCR36DRAFT_414427 [Piromyces finnis]|uniref:Vacuolar membrane protein n=1 Tax=Piromyces finnis TaxID=1754191 RepID=A0A1Y1V3G6_9FUNG|nr:hypothetical protein BCR36DRAFT_414427 [Piromyces finnis]|eukprot:ORX45563.1 hypothetical protein BCR36DRAFT_414427 [Piromyces finnis]
MYLNNNSTFLNSTENVEDLHKNEIDNGDCKLLDSWALIVQACMGMIAVSILIVKRQKENPKRPFKTWALDTMKQITGQLMIHSFNIILSYIRIFNSSAKESNPCIWYFLNLFLDTTIGIFILKFYLCIVNKIFINVLKISHCELGYYGDDPEKPLISAWIKQTIIFIICLCLMKISVVVIITEFPIFIIFGHFVIDMISKNVKVQVIFDMLILPLTMNAIQFWFIDKIIKADESTKCHFELLDGISELDDNEFSDINRLLK